MIYRCLLSLLLLSSLTRFLQADSLPLEAVKPLLPATDETRALRALREWSEAHRNCTRVEGKFLRVWYDDVFERLKISEGEFAYFGPRRAFCEIRPSAHRIEAENRKKGRNGEPYSDETDESEGAVRCYWLAKRFLVLNHKEQSFEAYPYLKREERSWFLDLNLEADALFPPFLPGNPNQQYFDQLTRNGHFKVFRESQTHIWITGKPKEPILVQNCQEFKLYLEKSPWRLKAIQLIHPGGNQSTVYIVNDIKYNPPEWGEPDLTGYQGQEFGGEEVEWPVEARYPETRERGPVEAQRPDSEWTYQAETHSPKARASASSDFPDPVWIIGFALWNLVF
ncbi:hypothetical protein V6x_16740 [Gimesia chilikensis]|uniref:Uncharacterized protein n=1 Tax=Gimesia chilikensis TaxID=2605989 RepID=A0A517W9Q1_9PLAN|nr:hypothetical protein [Gimesia chilikensis]QDU01990.1 hypothetical protein V6x_16740 [Gimesia chilikensis]